MGGEDFSTVQYMYVRHFLPAIMLIFQGQKTFVHHFITICKSLVATNKQKKKIFDLKFNYLIKTKKEKQ